MCPNRILFLDAYMFWALVECWTCKWYFAFKLINLHVWIIPYVNEHYGHYSIVIACMVKPWFIALFHFAQSHCACFICITSFFAYNDQIVLLCFRRYLLWKNWLFAFLSHSSINTPYTHEILRTYRKNFEREKQDWLIHNLYIVTLQIPQLSPSPLLHHWEVLYQIFFSPYPHLWEGFLVLWEAVRKGPIHIGWCYEL